MYPTPPLAGAHEFRHLRGGGGREKTVVHSTAAVLTWAYPTLCGLLFSMQASLRGWSPRLVIVLDHAKLYTFSTAFFTPLILSNSQHRWTYLIAHTRPLPCWRWTPQAPLRLGGLVQLRRLRGARVNATLCRRHHGTRIDAYYTRWRCAVFLERALGPRRGGFVWRLGPHRSSIWLFKAGGLSNHWS